MTVATEGGKIASRVRVSSAAPDDDRPCPRAIADSMDDLGNPAFFAVAIACASRVLTFGLAPYSADITAKIRATAVKRPRR